MRNFLVTTVLMCLTPGLAGAAEVALRERATPAGSIVRLGDIAVIVPDGAANRANAAADAATVAELAAIPLMPAPAPGTQKFLSAAQLRDLLAASAVDVQSVTIIGAQVAIKTPAVAVASPAVPGAVPPQRPTREVAVEALAAAVTQYVREQTGHELWNVTVAPEATLIDVYSQFGGQLTVSGGRAPFTGRQRFDLVAAGLDRNMFLFATVERIEMAVVAVRPIAKGDFVRATDVEVRPITGVLPPNAVESVAAAVGKEAAQPVRVGAVVTASHVRSPLLVRRGERVTVFARAAGIKVSTYATAQQDGSLGDLIPVQALDSKDRYSARVSGLRELDVLAVGIAAEDVAAAR